MRAAIKVSSTPVRPRLPRPARQLLEHAGLRSSLPRLNILDALVICRKATAVELHAFLEEPGLPISLSCVSQTLRRLHLSGLLERDTSKRYSLAPGAVAAMGKSNELH
jgi:Fe2+ or Zn2+ uptake regulation protein